MLTLKQITNGIVRRAKEDSVTQRDYISGPEEMGDVGADLGYEVDEKTGDLRIVQY